MRKEETKTYRYFDDSGVEWENELQALVSDFIDSQFKFLELSRPSEMSILFSHNNVDTLNAYKKGMLSSLISITKNPAHDQFIVLLNTASMLQNYVGRIQNSSSYFESNGNVITNKNAF